MSRFFDPLEALEAVQLVNCSALDAGRYAVESGDSFGVEGDRPRCEHWWPAPQGRGGCIPLLARDHFEDVMMLAWRHELPVCVAQAASLEAFQDFIRTKRVLFYWWSDATFAELDPQEVFLPFKALPSYGRKRVNAALQAGSRTKVDDVSSFQLAVASYQGPVTPGTGAGVTHLSGGGTRLSSALTIILTSFLGK